MLIELGAGLCLLFLLLVTEAQFSLADLFLSDFLALGFLVARSSEGV